MLRIALVQTYHPYTQFTHVHPLGVMMIAANARAQGFDDLHVLDMKVEGWTPEQAADAIVRLAPDVVGLSAMTYEAGCMHAVAKLVKLRMPRAVVACGGPHPSVAAADVLADPSVDFVVRGEGEFTFAELLAGVRDGRTEWTECAGLSWRDASGSIASRMCASAGGCASTASHNMISSASISRAEVNSSSGRSTSSAAMSRKYIERYVALSGRRFGALADKRATAPQNRANERGTTKRRKDTKEH